MMPSKRKSTSWLVVAQHFCCIVAYVMFGRPLVPLDFAGVDKKAKNEELKSVIEKIPTDKDQLFNYVIDWNVLDQVIRISFCCLKIQLEFESIPSSYVL